MRLLNCYVELGELQGKIFERICNIAENIQLKIVNKVLSRLQPNVLNQFGKSSQQKDSQLIEISKLNLQ
ncbi:MAG: hypothetical protein COC15_04630 [Legionellales bacterium]|nr:MAG: hypothetical protein COC15_04630 [Legionellales bacterium]